MKDVSPPGAGPAFVASSAPVAAARLAASPAFVASSALVDAYAALRPDLATFMGVAGHDDRWPDYSPDGTAALAALLRDARARFAALGAPADRWERLAVDVATDWIAGQLDALDAHAPELDLDALACPIALVPMALVETADRHPAESEVTLRRLEGLPAALDGYRRTLDAGRARGAGVARRQVVAAVAAARSHADAARPGVGAYALLDEPGRPAARAYDHRVEAAAGAAHLAWSALADWLEAGYLPAARAEDGVGPERYARELRRWLGASPDPRELYAWGLDEVRRVHGEMVALGERLAPGVPLATLTERLTTAPEHCAPSAEAFLDGIRARLHAATEALDGAHFVIPAPLRRIEVRARPGHGQHGAYYVPPTEDLATPGAITYLLPADGPYELWREASTAYHEGVPGHHLQLGTQVALADRLSRLHRLGDGYSGYAEGWALYAEALMGELGFYERPEEQLGRLANELVRALRVVLDIGAHLGLRLPADAPFAPGERVTYEVGVAALTTLAGLHPRRAAFEMLRYLGLPGQAVSYKAGERVMLALRRRWLDEGRGPLSAFHARVLGSGNVALDRLDALVLGA